MMIPPQVRLGPPPRGTKNFIVLHRRLGWVFPHYSSTGHLQVSQPSQFGNIKQQLDEDQIVGWLPQNGD